MSEKKPINPPAFPVFNSSGTPTYNLTTLRDYFAAKAMVAIITRPAGITRLLNKEIAVQAYTMADDMLKERKRNNDEESPTT